MRKYLVTSRRDLRDISILIDGNLVGMRRPAFVARVMNLGLMKPTGIVRFMFGTVIAAAWIRGRPASDARSTFITLLFYKDPAVIDDMISQTISHMLHGGSTVDPISHPACGWNQDELDKFVESTAPLWRSSPAWAGAEAASIPDDISENGAVLADGTTVDAYGQRQHVDCPVCSNIDATGYCEGKAIPGCVEASL